jgi:hypothetical protein
MVLVIRPCQVVLNVMFVLSSPLNSHEKLPIFLSLPVLNDKIAEVLGEDLQCSELSIHLISPFYQDPRGSLLESLMISCVRSHWRLNREEAGENAMTDSDQ